MAKATPRRRVALDSPEGMRTLAERLLEQVKPYATWLVIGGVVIALGLAAWGIKAGMQQRREAKAAAALASVTAKVDFKAATADNAKVLGQFVQEYNGTRAGREARLMQANLLYGLGQYADAAKAYEALLDGRDPGWDLLVTESLSYCYEGLGNFKKAAEVLKPAAEQAYGPLKTEIIRRLAMLYDKAKEPKEAAVYWRKLLEKPPDATLVPYLQEKLAATEAASKK